MNEVNAAELVKSVDYWHHDFEIYPGVRTFGNYDPGFLFSLLNLEDDLSDARILEIGPSDGYFTVQLENRGADVTCVEYRAKDHHGYAVTEKINGLKARYIQGNVFDITPAKFGQYDIVLFLGVLYHLPDMVRALHVLRQVTMGRILIETAADTSLPSDLACARYYVGDTLAGDPTNFWVPNVACVEAMCMDVGFTPLRSESWPGRALVEARRGATTDKLRASYGKL